MELTEDSEEEETGGTPGEICEGVPGRISGLISRELHTGFFGKSMEKSQEGHRKNS